MMVLRRIAVVLMLLGSVACRQMTVAGNAMSPTLTDGERVKAVLATGSLTRGDIVALKYPQDESKMFVQRIIGLPGQRIEMQAGVMFVDGKPIDERYVLEANRSFGDWGPRTIPDDEYFVMGNNRRNSSDSRHWGTVRRSLIVAKIDRP